MKKKTFYYALSTILLVWAFGTKEKSTLSVDTTKSTVKWTGYHLGKSYEHQGNVSLKSGNLDISNGKITGGKFVADMSTITCSDLKGKDNQKLVGHLKSEDFFYVEKHPLAKIVIEKVKGKKATGKVTIRGITEPIEFDFETKKASDSYVSAKATLKIDRSKHKVLYGWSMENMVISNEFQLEVNIVASK